MQLIKKIEVIDNKSVLVTFLDNTKIIYVYPINHIGKVFRSVKK